jgi:hypothetical protein
MCNSIIRILVMSKLDSMLAGKMIRTMMTFTRTMRKRMRKRRLTKPPRATPETRTAQVGILFHVLPECKPAQGLPESCFPLGPPLCD